MTDHELQKYISYISKIGLFFIPIFIFAYLMFAFVSGNFLPSEWYIGARAVFAVVVSFVLFILLISFA